MDVPLDRKQAEAICLALLAQGNHDLALHVATEADVARCMPDDVVGERKHLQRDEGEPFGTVEPERVWMVKDVRLRTLWATVDGKERATLSVEYGCVRDSTEALLVGSEVVRLRHRGPGKGVWASNGAAVLYA